VLADLHSAPGHSDSTGSIHPDLNRELHSVRVRPSIRNVC
jgi:hypothetical protein